MSRKQIDWKANDIIIISMNCFNQSTTNSLYAITTGFVPNTQNEPNKLQHSVTVELRKAAHVSCNTIHFMADYYNNLICKC